MTTENTAAIGIVILNYNNYSVTFHCVDSVLQQENVQMKIVIVDNASKNESYALLTDRYKADARITVILNKENLGFARGNNVGIHYLRERGISTVFLLNSDIVLTTSDILADMSREIHDGVGLVYGNVYRPDGSEEFKIEFKHRFLLLRILKNLFEQSKIQRLKKREAYAKPKDNVQAKTTDISAAEHTSGPGDSRQKYRIDEDRYVVPGCAYMLTESFFESYVGLYPDTFLYYEEYAMILYLYKAHLKTEYVNTNRILHEHKASTGSVNVSIYEESIKAVAELLWKSVL